MSVPELSERQRRLAAATWAVAEDDHGAAEARRDQPAAPGDRYTLRATAGLPVEWVLLERHPRRPAFRAVAADVHPFLGSADLAVPASTLRLRCGASVWVEEQDLDPACRAGAVDRLTVERARQKLLARGRETAAGVEADESPEYADWMREVVRLALATAGSPEAPEEREERAPVPPRRLWRNPVPYAVAASVFLLLTLGLAISSGQQKAEIDRLAARERSAEAVRQQERSRQAEERLAEQRSWQRQLAANQATAVELARRLAELERSIPRLPETLVNVPVALLTATERVRGEAPKVARIEAGAAPYVTVVLNLDDTTAYDSYRVIATRRGAAAPIWQSDGLKRTGRGLQFALERRRIPSGSYHFQVFGLRAGRAEALADYDLVVA